MAGDITAHLNLVVYNLIVLGLDPGIATVGFGIVSSEKGCVSAIRYGVFRTSPGIALSRRLGDIYDDVNEIIKQFKPDAIAIEKLFFNTNHKTGISVAHGRGVLLLAAYKCGVPIFEYTPLQVKSSVTGYGRAEKKQVMEMVRRLLKLDSIPKPDDAADALAIAICHARAATSLIYEKWSNNACSTT